MAKQEQEKLNTFRQKQLGRVTGKQYPERISNKNCMKNVNANQLQLK